jgi:hypothetical protein
MHSRISLFLKSHIHEDVGAIQYSLGEGIGSLGFCLIERTNHFGFAEATSVDKLPILIM